MGVEFWVDIYYFLCLVLSHKNHCLSVSYDYVGMHDNVSISTKKLRNLHPLLLYGLKPAG